jgi:hypothetical protein
MYEITDTARRAAFFRDLEDCTAVLLAGCSFVDGSEQEYEISFYLWGIEVVRTEYNRRTTSTRTHIVDDGARRRLLDISSETNRAITEMYLA